jgi:hypothetical protein
VWIALYGEVMTVGGQDSEEVNKLKRTEKPTEQTRMQQLMQMECIVGVVSVLLEFYSKSITIIIIRK